MISSPGDTLISCENDARLLPIGSAWNRRVVEPNTMFDGITNRVVVLPVAWPSRMRRFRPATSSSTT